MNNLQVNGVFINVPSSYETNAEATTILPSGTKEMCIRDRNKVTDVKIVNGNKDVTANYSDIEKIDGELSITKRIVTLTSATDSKVYDGTPLTNKNVAVGADGFAKGEGAVYTVTGSQTESGTTDNTFTYESVSYTHLRQRFG